MTDAEAGAFDDANRLLREVERQWLDPEGLPARPFFRNTLIASDRDNGYANVQFPAVVESLRSDDPQSAGAAASLLASRIRRAAALVEEATAALPR